MNYLSHKAYTRLISFLGAVFLLLLVNALSSPNSAYRQVTDWVLAPFFQQRWQMFAPDPPAGELQLEFQFSASGPWVNVSSHLFPDFNEARISPRGRAYKQAKHWAYYTYYKAYPNAVQGSRVNDALPVLIANLAAAVYPDSVSEWGPIKFRAKLIHALQPELSPIFSETYYAQP